MAHTCRGTITLATVHIEVGDTCHFVMTSEGRSYHLKACSEGECQQWVSALQQAKTNATQMMHHSGRDVDSYHPLWFEKRTDSETGDTSYVYRGGYWEAKDRENWSQCPAIF